MSSDMRRVNFFAMSVNFVGARGRCDWLLTSRQARAGTAPDIARAIYSSGSRGVAQRHVWLSDQKHSHANLGSAMLMRIIDGRRATSSLGAIFVI